MNVGLGIDTGGTYTDAVLMDLDTGRVIEKNKARTTHDDLVVGIVQALDGLSSSLFDDIRLTSISTTLATNTTLEGKGYPCGLIMVGYALSGEIPTPYSLEIRGGHDADGNAVADPSADFALLEQFIEETKSNVSSYAVSSYFSVRNPEHELMIRQKIAEMTGLPVVCGHELSRALGVYERTMTAVLNARLIPVTDMFVRSVLDAMKKRGIDSDLMIMKCDGSLVNLEDALAKPVESVFSGPAASLVGAAHLTGDGTCVTVDVGGTSTDISMIVNGVPEIGEEGATVGGWKTMVRAIEMNTWALGGDSLVRLDQGLRIGPRRVIPVSVAGARYPDLVEKLQTADVPSERILDNVIQGSSFFIRVPKIQAAHLMTSYESKVYEAVSGPGESPSLIGEIAERLGDHPILFSNALESLILKGYVSQIGFTPTDALHVLGVYKSGSEEAARLAASILAEQMHMTAEDLCRLVRKNVSVSMAKALASFFLPEMKASDIDKLITGSPFTKFKIDIPVVLIGAPVAAYAEEFGSCIDANVVLPEYHDVGNAVGALVGNIIYRTEVLIRPQSIGSSVYIAFNDDGRVEYESHKEAVEKSISYIKSTIYKHMMKYGMSEDSVRIDIKRNEIQAGVTTSAPLEVRLFGTGIATPGKIGRPASEGESV